MNKNLFRDRKDYIARIFLLPLFMVFIIIFLGRLKHTQASIQDRIGLAYQSATVPAFMGMINSVALCKCIVLLHEHIIYSKQKVHMDHHIHMS